MQPPWLKWFVYGIHRRPQPARPIRSTQKMKMLNRFFLGF